MHGNAEQVLPMPTIPDLQEPSVQINRSQRLPKMRHAKFVVPLHTCGAGVPMPNILRYFHSHRNAIKAVPRVTKRMGIGVQV